MLDRATLVHYPCSLATTHDNTQRLNTHAPVPPGGARPARAGRRRRCVRRRERCGAPVGDRVAPGRQVRGETAGKRRVCGFAVLVVVWRGMLCCGAAGRLRFEAMAVEETKARMLWSSGGGGGRAVSMWRNMGNGSRAGGRHASRQSRACVGGVGVLGMHGKPRVRFRQHVQAVGGGSRVGLHASLISRGCT